MRIDEALRSIAASRQQDPLAAATVITPTRLASLQLRRRLAQHGAFAGVRFETSARIAELLAAGDLARQGRRPLARPIADYVAQQVARESQGPLAGVAELNGYAVALRQTFRRLRRAGFRNGEEVPLAPDSGQLREIARLYSSFRQQTADFYDDEDLLEAAGMALKRDPSGVLPEMGSVWVINPLRGSAASAAFLDAIKDVAEAYVEVEALASPASERFVLAPDAASEARSVVRAVLSALSEGVGLHEIAIFYSGDSSYRALMAQTLESAGLPIASMPGTPLNETSIGRAVLALARLPLQQYSRAGLFDFLGLAPTRAKLPAEATQIQVRAGQWQRVAREAGVTQGDRWIKSLELFSAGREQALQADNQMSEGRRSLYESDIETAGELQSFVRHLVSRLEPLEASQAASSFIPRFRALIEDYFQPGANGLEEIEAEIDQLGTIDAVGGQFSLSSFADALEANLKIAARRDRPLGDGVLLASYRVASGLEFQRVFVCGAYEGALPAVIESEPLIEDAVWSWLRQGNPYVEDLRSRVEEGQRLVSQVIATSCDGVLTWSSPLQAPNATREHYPSTAMTAAARRRDDSIETAGALRQASRDWLQKAASPLSALLSGPALDVWEKGLRTSLRSRRGEIVLAAEAPIQAALRLIRSRRSSDFTAYDGNLAELAGSLGPAPGANMSPTALESYATCGLRYFLSSVLRLRGVKEPDERETLGATERGTLVHTILERFFREAQAEARPRVRERWQAGDQSRLLEILDEEFARLQQSGRAGFDIYADYDLNLIRADLVAFLEHDSDFREQTGAIPVDFERRLAPQALGKINLTGFVDRIDVTPDGKHAYVIDYKTGKVYEKKRDEGPFADGTKLQLPVYILAASEAEQVEALYWFISQRGGFQRVTYKETDSSREHFEATVSAILHGMSSGSFPAVPGDEDEFRGGNANCRFCDFDSICSRRRLVEFQEKIADPGAQGWSGVSAASRGQMPR